MKTGLNGIMSIDVKGMEELKRCAANVMSTVKQLNEVISELQECELDINCNLDFGNGVESESIISVAQDDIQEEFTPFGRDDLEDIISDLQEEYFRLDCGKDVALKIKIADKIERLCRLRETMEE